MIVIREEAYRDIVEFCRGELPLEACGLLAGVVKDGKRYIQKVYCLSNAAKSRTHFSMMPKEQFWAIHDMRKEGWELLGNFHSHPSTQAWPSGEDLGLANDTNLVYLILSLMEENCPNLRAYRFDRKKNVISEQIKIENGSTSLS